MGGRPTKIPELEMKRPDGSLFTRTEMEAQIREHWDSHQSKRLRAINPYGLASKVAFDTPTIVILHWLLDTMIAKGEITGEVLGIDIPAPGHYDDPTVFNQFKQRLAIAIEQGQALQPQKGEGIDMSTTAPPPAIPGAPPNGQSGQAGYTPPPAAAMPGAAPPPLPGAAPAQAAAPAQPAAPQPTEAPTGATLFPKEDPDRPWGKPSPSGGKSRRTKQEMGEDQLWEKLGKPNNLQFATFDQVYGVSYAKAKKDKMLGPGGAFPDLPNNTAAAAPAATQQPQTQEQQMNQPPVPMPPGMPQPPQQPAAAPQPPQAAAPPPPMPGMPPQVGQPPQMPQPPQQQAPQAAAPPPPPQTGQPAGVPAPHPNAPVVPPPPGTAPQPPQPGMTSMPPQQQSQQPQQAAGGADLTKVLEQQAEIINRLASIESRLASVDAATALALRSQFQRQGDYTCAALLGEFQIPVPQ